MVDDFLEERAPKFYGSTTVGERGQVVIPAEARKEFQIISTTKLLVFGNKRGGALMLMKAESVTKFLSKAMSMLTRVEEELKTETDRLLG